MLLMVGLALALAFFLEQQLERGVDALVARVWALPTLAIVATGTVLLAAARLRYGGARVLRLWGIVLKPEPRERA